MEGNCCRHCEEQEDCAQTIHFVAGQMAEVKETLERIEAGFVRHVEFKPVKTLVYGMVGLILAGFVGALVTVAVNRIGGH